MLAILFSMRCRNVVSESAAMLLLLACPAIRVSAAQLSTFPVPDYSNSWAFGINDNGYVVGAAGSGRLLPPGSFYGAYGADGGQWAGNIVTGVLYGKGHVTWLGSSYTEESHDGCCVFTTFTFATGINNAGVIVGSTIEDQTLPIGPYTDQLGYLFNGNLNGIPADGFGPATAINNKGQIVGSRVFCTGFGCGQGVESQRGYLLDGGVHGRLTDLNPSGDPDGGFRTIPNSINDAGQVVGPTHYLPFRRNAARALP